MKRVGFLYDEIFLKHIMPQFHPESPERLEVILKTLKNSDIWDKLIHNGPRRATVKEIEAVHDPDYVKWMSGFTGYADPDTYVSGDTYEAALYAAGAVLTAVHSIKEGWLDRAFCAVRPPGHHAEANRAMGFCIFNNIAVGARGAQRLGMKRVFIIDFDVHHGNGTQHMFEADPSVYYLSTHQYPFYPGTGADSETGSGAGEGTVYNIPMPPGSGDKQYMRVYQDIVPPLVSRFNPDIVLVSAGYDIYKDDPLAGIRVSEEGLRAIVKAILSAAGDLPVVFTLEGGYDLSALGGLVEITLREMLYSV